MKYRGLLNAVESGSVLTNLIFSGYIFFIHEILYDYFFHDMVQGLSKSAIMENRGNVPLGIILLAVIIAEFFAYLWKSSSGVKSGASTGIFLLWIFHTVIAVIMSITAMTLLGYGIDNPGWQITLVIFLTVIKELAILGVVAVGEDNAKGAGRVMWKSMVSDIIFAIFYSLAYTIVIGNILQPGGYENYLFASWYAKPLVVMNLFIILLLFFMLYMPLRMPYFIFERSDGKPGSIASSISILLVAVAVVTPHFKGEVSLDMALENPEKTEILFLNSRGLDKVPDSIGRLKKLRVLHLGHNRLTELPESIGELKNLRWLNIEGNRLKILPPEIVKLESLEELNVRYNRISEFPADLKGLRHIEKIKAGLNRLKSGEVKRIKGFLGSEHFSYR